MPPTPTHILHALLYLLFCLICVGMVPLIAMAIAFTRLKHSPSWAGGLTAFASDSATRSGSPATVTAATSAVATAAPASPAITISDGPLDFQQLRDANLATTADIEGTPIPLLCRKIVDQSEALEQAQHSHAINTTKGWKEAAFAREILLDRLCDHVLTADLLAARLGVNLSAALRDRLARKAIATNTAISI